MHDGVQLLLDGGKIKVGCQRKHSCLIQLNAYSEKALRATKEEHTDVEALAALDVGDEPDERIIIGAELEHARPPPQSNAKLSGGRAGTPGRPRGANQGRQRMGRARASCRESL